MEDGGCSLTLAKAANLNTLQPPYYHAYGNQCARDIKEVGSWHKGTIIVNWCSMWHYGITQSQHCNNEKDDNVMHVSAWFEYFDGSF
jgi:hypothetical protein